MAARRRLVGALLTVAVLTAPAAAQDGSGTAEQRTVEGAQQFLGDFYDKIGARAETAGWITANGWSWTDVPGGKRQMVEGKLVSLKPVGRCKSVATISGPIHKKWRGRDPVIPVAVAGGVMTLEVDWSKLNKVASEAGWKYEDGGPSQVPSGWTDVLIYWPDGHFFVNHWDKADAQRAAFAMQFLREQCGVKSDTGF